MNEGSATSRVVNSASNLADKGKQAASDLGDRASEFAHSAQNALGSAAEKIQEGWGEARTHAADYLRRGSESARIVGQDLRSQVIARPVLTLLIAVGIGFLAGVLVSRD